MVVRAEGGMSGIPRETLNLVVLEGLHQLGLHDVDVSIPQEKTSVSRKRSSSPQLAPTGLQFQ